MAKGQKTGGRRKGTPNRATAEIKAAFQQHGDELVDALLALTKSDDERVRLGAIQACLDRGWGKAVQGLEISGGVAIDVIKDGAPDWIRERLEAVVIEHEDQEEEPELPPHLPVISPEAVA